MRTISIYKNQAGEFIFDGFVTKTGQWRKKVPTSPGAYNFREVGSLRDYFQGDIHYSQILDESGDPYASAEAFESATVGCWAGEGLFSTLITAIGGFFTNLINAVNSSGGGKKHTYKVVLTRPANATPYSAGDIIGDVTTLFKAFAEDISKANGYNVDIYRVRLQTNDTGLAGKSVDIHFYEDTPDITGLADNSQMALSDSNALIRMGATTVIFGTGTKGKVGANDWSLVTGNLADKKLRFIISTNDAFTPSANSTTITVCVSVEQSNI